jgi:hypothetical protein
MALTQNWKYIYSAAEHREYLFDLKVDPDETRNRAETLGYLEQTRQLRTQMFRQLQQDGCSAVLDGDNWRTFPAPPFPRDPDAGLLFQDADWAATHLTIAGYGDDEAQSTDMDLI